MSRLEHREQVRAVITPVLGYPVANTELRWPRGYAVYGWDSTGFGVLRACCPAVQSAGELLARKVRDDVRAREVFMWAGAPIGARSKWLAKNHPTPTSDHLESVRTVVDAEREYLRGPIEHGFVLGWDRPVSSVWTCCPVVEDHMDLITKIVRRTTPDQHLSHR